MKLHILKIETCYFNDILSKRKTFEIRKNDRDYQLGDLIHFVHYNGDEFINSTEVFKITYILKDVSEYGLDKDYCILGIKELKEYEK